MPSFWRGDIDPARENVGIMIERGALTDAARHDRKIPYKIYYPAEGVEKLPVILWSHGLGGNRDGAGFISRFLAGHGYIVVHIQHHGTDSTLWEGKPGHPWDVIRATPIELPAILDRYQDVPFALRALEEFSASIPAGDRMDFGRLGMSGHSFGANTTQVMAGQMIGPGERQRSLREPRFKAGILYSPVPSSNRQDSPGSIYGPIAMPLFHMTGTADASPIEGFGYEKRLEVFENSGGPEQHLLALNGGDHMVYNGSRGQLGENPKRALHEDIIKIAALAYWDTYLKNSSDARQWLTGGGFANYLGDEGRYIFRK
jgi:dienelactone hydrolase